MNKIILIIGIIISFLSFSQKCDTIIKKDIFTSYYSFKLKNPIILTYKLYKGGGECERSQFHFKIDSSSKIAKPSDYESSGYDLGHLLSAEDMAYSCHNMEETFYMYNCFPQLPSLNRGVWKKLENNVRKLSQSDSLFIIVGAFYGNKKIGQNVYIPTYCFKIVYSLKSKKIIITEMYSNEKDPLNKKISFEDLNKLIINQYNINVKNFLK